LGNNYGAEEPGLPGGEMPGMNAKKSACSQSKDDVIARESENRFVQKKFLPWS